MASSNYFQRAMEVELTGTLAQCSKAKQESEFMFEGTHKIRIQNTQMPTSVNIDGGMLAMCLISEKFLRVSSDCKRRVQQELRSAWLL